MWNFISETLPQLIALFVCYTIPVLLLYIMFMYPNPNRPAVSTEGEPPLLIRICFMAIIMLPQIVLIYSKFYKLPSIF